jgi:hypothetical protein
MANFRRRRPRDSATNTHRGSETSWRAKMGLTPIRLPHEAWKAMSLDDWLACWHGRRAHGNWGKKIGGPYSRMNNNPAWWDRVFHTAPRRAKERVITRAIVKGAKDPDSVCWPLAKKPHIYYW